MKTLLDLFLALGLPQRAIYMGIGLALWPFLSPSIREALVNAPFEVVADLMSISSLMDAVCFCIPNFSLSLEGLGWMAFDLLVWWLIHSATSDGQE